MASTPESRSCRTCGSSGLRLCSSISSVASRCRDSEAGSRSRPTVCCRIVRCSATYASGLRWANSASKTSRTRSCRCSPSPERPTNGRASSQRHTSGARGPTVAASRSSVVRYACAQVARPMRWSASGTSRTSTRHSSATSCGSWSSRVGTLPPAQASASRVRVSGWPRPSAARRPRWSSGTPRRPSSSTLSAGGSTARSSRRSSCRQPGSADQPASGGSRPASTTTASAGSEGSRCSRNHRSSRVSSSYPSTSSTGPGPSGSAATALATSSMEPPRSRPCSSSAGRCACTARRRSSSSSVDLPMPPGPCTNSTRAGSVPASAAVNDRSSGARPTKPRRRASSRTAERVGPIARAPRRYADRASGSPGRQGCRWRARPRPAAARPPTSAAPRPRGWPCCRPRP